MKIHSKKKLSIFAAPIVLLASNSVFADMDFCATPFIGADVAWRYLNLPNSKGGQLVKKDRAQGDIYAGVKLCDYIGIQAGFESTTARHDTRDILGSGDYFGSPYHAEVPNGINRVVTTSQLYGWHADLVGYLPFCDCYSLLGSVGVAHLKYKMRWYNPILDSIAEPESAIGATIRTYKQRKIVPRLGLGIQKMITDCAGVRLIGTWEGTSRIKNISSKENASSLAKVSLRNSTTLGFGIFYNF